MTPVMIALFSSLLVGIGLTTYGVVGMMAKKNETEFEYAPKNNEFGEKFKDADKIMNELSSFSENVFKDVDGKHQELMFLYTLIDEKKQELVDAYNKSMEPQVQQVPVAEAKVEQKPKHISAVVDTSRYVDNAKWEKAKEVKVNKEEFSKSFVDSNPQHREILKLYSEGATVADIAKKLAIGQMEVKLILELLVGN